MVYVNVIQYIYHVTGATWSIVSCWERISYRLGYKVRFASTDNWLRHSISRTICMILNEHENIDSVPCRDCPNDEKKEVGQSV